jgi:RNA recognition motif-containing protein
MSHSGIQQPFRRPQGVLTTTNHPNRSPCEVFVGYLPHACDERQLFDFFNQYHHVQEARIMRSNSADHESLLYGFVRLKSPDEVCQAVKLLNNTVFGGRRIR